MTQVDNLDLQKYISEGEAEILKGYLNYLGKYFEFTSKILNKLGQLSSEDKFQGEGVVANRLKRIEKILNHNMQNQNGQPTNGDDESEQPQQSPVVLEAQSPTVSTPEEGSQNGTKTIAEKVISPPEVVIPIPRQGINNKPNPQTTTHRPKAKPNVYDNKGFGKEIIGLVGAIVGTIIGTTITYLPGAATLTPIAAIAVFFASAVAGAIICYCIAEICEKVSRKKQNDPRPCEQNFKVTI